MSASVTESREFAQPIDHVYEVCSSDVYLVHAEDERIEITEVIYEPREDGSVYSKLTLEQQVNVPDKAPDGKAAEAANSEQGANAEQGENPQPKLPRSISLTQTNTVSPFDGNAFTIVSDSPLPMNLGTMKATFAFSGVPNGTRLDTTVDVDVKIPLIRKKVEKEVLKSVPDSVDKTVKRIVDLAIATWGC